MDAHDGHPFFMRKNFLTLFFQRIKIPDWPLCGEAFGMEGSKIRGCLRGGVSPKPYRLKLKVMTPSLYDTSRLPFMSLAMSRAIARPMP